MVLHGRMTNFQALLDGHGHKPGDERDEDLVSRDVLVAKHLGPQVSHTVVNHLTGMVQKGKNGV